jgi:ubiquinone/menaquinone biosynthesis C-methylase UbiE
MSGTSDHNARILAQFSQQAKSYATLTNSAGTPQGSPLFQAVRPAPTDRVLDVGCGAGRVSVSLASLVAHVTGVDLTPAMLDQARALQARAGVSNIEWKQADSTALPLADGAFDLVISQAMFHHAADPAATLAEMRRVCAPGGRIAVNDLTPAPEKACAFDAIELLRDPSHRRAYTAEALRALGAGQNLEEMSVHAYTTELPIEAVLATSFPDAGMLERVRELYSRDAAGGYDSLGMGARLQDGAVWVRYPMTVVVWRRR